LPPVLSTRFFFILFADTLHLTPVPEGVPHLPDAFTFLLDFRPPLLDAILSLF
jgi:hypothetical protein